MYSAWLSLHLLGFGGSGQSSSSNVFSSADHAPTGIPNAVNFFVRCADCPGTSLLGVLFLRSSFQGPTVLIVMPPSQPVPQSRLSLIFEEIQHDSTDFNRRNILIQWF